MLRDCRIEKVGGHEEVEGISLAVEAAGVMWERRSGQSRLVSDQEMTMPCNFQEPNSGEQ